MQKNSIRLAADITIDSIVDGPGLRAVIWTQGCPHHCKNCQNPQTWDYKGGLEVDIDLVYKEIDNLEDQDGITISGGDPMFQPESCSLIAKYAKEKGYNIWVYTGYTFEKLLSMGNVYKDFLKYIDILVDGPFIEEKKNLNLLFRGSENQRLIDVQKTLKTGEIVLFDEEKYNGISFKKTENIFV